VALEKNMDVLTPRERECLECLAQGLTNAGIAARLGLALPTVAMHLANARKRLGAHTREEAVAKAVSLGLIALRRTDKPQAVPIYLVVGQHSCKPEDLGAPAVPRLLDVEQRIVEDKLEFEVKEVGFRFVLSNAHDIRAVLIRWRCTEVNVQPFYWDVNRNLHETACHSTSGGRTCECWGTGCSCFPLAEADKPRRR
jgi:DNA-binding CsgD family transcriptional regulator